MLDLSGPAGPRPALATSLGNPAFSTGKAIGDAFALFLRHGVAFATAAVVVFTPAVLVDLVALQHRGADRISSLVWNLLGCFATAALTRGTLDAIEGRTPTVSRLLGGIGSGLRVFGASLASGIIIVLGIVCLVVPGLVAASGLWLATAIAVAEPERPVTASIERSWTLTRGHRAGVLAMAILFLAIPVTITFCAGFLAGDGGVATLLAGYLLALGLGLQAVAVAVAYHALRAEKEGAAAPALAAVFE
jgi:hypothetical protein